MILDRGQSVGFILEAGFRVRITDLVGLQIGTLCAYAEPADGKEFSWGRSTQQAAAARAEEIPGMPCLLEGELLISADGDEMMRITADTMEIKGIQNFHATICNQQVKVASGSPYHDYCYEAAYRAAEPWGLVIPTTDAGRYNSRDFSERLDLFAKPQNHTAASLAAQDNPEDRIAFGADGRVEDYAAEIEKSDRWQTLGESVSRPGDYLEFEALIDCLVTCANCIHGDENSMKLEFFG